jgi:hypothetical protein
MLYVAIWVVDGCVGLGLAVFVGGWTLGGDVVGTNVVASGFRLVGASLGLGLVAVGGAGLVMLSTLSRRGASLWNSVDLHGRVASAVVGRGFVVLAFLASCTLGSIGRTFLV